MSTQNQTQLPLIDEWKQCLKSCAKGYELRTEGNKLTSEGNDLCAKGYELSTKGDKHYAEGNKLYAEGYKLKVKGSGLKARASKIYTDARIAWFNTIIKTYGEDMSVTSIRRDDYKASDCILGNGDTYTVEMGKE